MFETLEANLLDDDTIICEGVKYVHRTPILHLARVLAGRGEKRLLDVKRGGLRAFLVDISVASKLDINEGKYGPYFRKYLEETKP